MMERVDPKRLTLDLSGKWYRGYGVAPCPCCQPDRRRDQKALTVAERGGKLLLHCKKSGCDFVDLLSACGIRPGGFEVDLEAIRKAALEQERREMAAAMRARAIWDQGQPIGGTPGEDYLRGRGITCALPQSLRWVGDLYHAPSKQDCSAICARVVRPDGQAKGLHRTFFAKAGQRLESDAKMMLGPCRGGAVHLAEGDGPLVVSEGIETGLSLASGLLTEPATVWAALSAPGLSGLILPPDAGRLIVASDGDPAGRKAAHQLAERASSLGWAVSMLPAPDGCDWNDVLLQGDRK